MTQTEAQRRILDSLASLHEKLEKLDAMEAKINELTEQVEKLSGGTQSVQPETKPTTTKKAKHGHSGTS